MKMISHDEKKEEKVPWYLNASLIGAIRKLLSTPFYIERKRVIYFDKSPKLKGKKEPIEISEEEYRLLEDD